ncbi:PAAR-like protein [Flavobacterium aquidurense]|uniref:DUF4280 domain containing protein n=1 Tax=Flavobacterium aquidurense TaxID=362413 RepID=A0A0Q0RN41_9FLAO|nr:PAAR-like protein [Flavobacterium aquidurense]KQB37495.1 DUF4280 domain containing protein [Flavobacterium aquidurense]
MSLKTITDSALVCEKGSESTLLKVTSQQYSKIKGMLIATEKDKDFPVNILPFGRCGILRNSCKCKPTVWQKTLKSKINNNAKLGKDSFILCDVGGKIEFKDTGENNFSKSESSNSSIFNSIPEKSTEELQEEINNNNEEEKRNITIILMLLFALSLVFGALYYKLSNTN